MPDVSVLEVLLHGAPVGTLTRAGGDRILFAFTDTYLDDEARPTLSLSFKDRFGALIPDIAPTRTRLPPFFANLLPEGPMRAYLADRAGVKSVREFFLLWVLGLDLPGAITIRPADGEVWPPDAATDARAAGGRSRRANALRFSLAGVQLKFSALEAASGGLTIPVGGVGGSRIVKLPSTRFADVPENEFSMMTLARLVGLDVPDVRLIDIDAIDKLPGDLGPLAGKRALVVERFDRLPDGLAVHIEDFAQVFGVYPEAKYERASHRNIATVIAAEGTQADIAEFIRRVIFTTLIGNADMHLKNWSLIYPNRRHAQLAPAYDLVSTIVHLPGDEAALNYSRTKRFDGLDADELVHLASKARLPEKLVLDTARETVALFHQHWKARKSHLPLPRAAVRAIDSHIKSLPIATLR